MDITRFTGALKFGGARTSNFLVNITNPITGVSDSILPFLCSAASIPPSNMEKVTLSFTGREAHFDGKRTFENWQVTIINDEDFLIRNAMETWFNAMNSPEGNINTTGSSSPSNYKAQGTVTQYDKNENPLRTYKFIGLFPVAIGAIELTWNENAIETFTVDFSVDYFDVEGNTGDAGGL